MVRLLLLLLGSFGSRRLAAAEPAWAGPDAAARAGAYTSGGWAPLNPAAVRDGGPAAPAEVPPQPWPGPVAGQPGGWPPPATTGGPHPPYRRRRRWIPRWVKWSAAAAILALIFRRAIASVVLMALSASLHFLGLNVHLPKVRLAWPWQTISAGTSSNALLGPWVLQKIEGISKPALGTENFSFVFTRKVSKNLGPWPCWYSSTFYAVGRASATVNLNPGPSWWTQSTGHYRLQVIAAPEQGRPGQVAISVVLPRPQLPQSAHDVSIDNTASRPLSTAHSWTYPGFGCGALIRPQFAQSVLYSEAQSLAFYRVSHVSAVSGPLVGAAESEAAQMIRNNFIQPTVNAFGYTLDRFTLSWSAAS
jgi:hypothetical protein